MEKLALAGDGESAVRLALNPEGDLDSATYWSTIAAEDGDARGMEWLAVLLKNKGDSQSKIRACYWLKKAGRACSAE
jgi:TPR repeat protein